MTAERVKQFMTGLLLPASLQVKPDTATLLNTPPHDDDDDDDDEHFDHFTVCSLIISF